MAFMINTARSRRGIGIAAALGTLLLATPALAAPPANDNIAQVQDLGTSSVPLAPVTGTTSEATLEAGEPGSGPGSVWYRFTPPQSVFAGFCVESAAGITAAPFGAGVADVSFLSPYADTPFAGGVCPNPAFPARFSPLTGGTDVWIQVSGQPGSFTLYVFDPYTCPNQKRKVRGLRKKVKKADGSKKKKLKRQLRAAIRKQNEVCGTG